MLDGTFVGEDGSERNVAIKYTRAYNNVEGKSVQEEINKVVGEPNQNHPNLIKYYGCKVLQGGRDNKFSVIIVMELMEETLIDFFFKDKHFGENITYGRFLQIFLEISKGLQELHAKRGIIHSDMKPSNILVSSSGKEIKITDFGGSKILSPERGSVTVQFKRDSKYVAPELVLLRQKDIPSPDCRVTKAIDIYSLGCMMWECANLLRIGCEHSDESTSGRIITWGGIQQAHQIQCNGPLVLCELIEECLKFNSAGLLNRQEGYGRPTADDITKRLQKMLKKKWVNCKIKGFKKVCDVFRHAICTTPYPSSLLFTTIKNSLQVYQI